ncbi:MAG: hypothetical protein AAGG07_07855 [Planctomycetota bacterium]
MVDLVAVVIVVVLQGLVYLRVSSDVAIIPGLFQDERQWHAVAVAVTLALTGAVFLFVRSSLKRSLLAVRRAASGACPTCGTAPKQRDGLLYRHKLLLCVLAAVLTVALFGVYRAMFVLSVRDLGEFPKPGSDGVERRVLVHPPLWRPAELVDMVRVLNSHGDDEQLMPSRMAYSDAMNANYAEFKRYLTVEDPKHLAATYGIFVVLHSMLVSGYAVTLALSIPVVAVVKRDGDGKRDDDSDGAVPQFYFVAGDRTSDVGSAIIEAGTSADSTL